jgi:hypothetical protein
MVAPCLAALSGQLPKPEGARLVRAELTAEARLDVSGAAINLQARRVDDEIAHAILFQQPMNPEPVIAGLIAANELNRTLQLATNAGANLVEELSQLLPAFHRVHADFVR